MNAFHFLVFTYHYIFTPPPRPLYCNCHATRDSTGQNPKNASGCEQSLKVSQYSVVGKLRSPCLFSQSWNRIPVTKRSRCMYVPIWLERNLGERNHKLKLRKYKRCLLPPQNPLRARIHLIFKRLLAAAIINSQNNEQRQYLKNLPWSVEIIGDPPDRAPYFPNAYVYPNGKILVFESILRICGNDDGIAVVLSHELAHQMARHYSEKLQQKPRYDLVLAVLNHCVGSERPWGSLPADPLKSQMLETEADRIGCELMARSCYDVREAPKFWLRMKRWVKAHRHHYTSGFSRKHRSSSAPSTHPSDDQRIQNTSSWIPLFQGTKRKYSRHAYQFQFFGDFAERLDPPFKPTYVLFKVCSTDVNEH